MSDRADEFYADLDWPPPVADTRLETPPAKCRHPKWKRGTLIVEKAGVRELVPYCTACEHRFDPARARRGRSSLRAGKDAERAIAKAYPGGKRTGQYGGQDDVLVGELFIVQSKAGGWFSNRYWNELAKLPRTGGRIPTLIVSDRPGPGRPTRRLVIREMSDDIALHGKEG